jgi:hypothetical protein
VQDDRFVVGNIGDSRVYHYTNGQLIQKSIDHSYIQELQQQSKEKIDQNIINKYSNYITRTVDGGKDQADILPENIPWYTLQKGDALMLCSDGLILNKHDTSTDHWIMCLLGLKTIKQTAEQLIADAFEKGSKDNITVVLATYGLLQRSKQKFKKYPYPPKANIKHQTELNKKSTVHKRLQKILLLSFVLAMVILLIYLFIPYGTSTKHDRTTTELKQEKPSPLSVKNEYPEKSHQQIYPEWNAFNAGLDVYRMKDEYLWNEYPDLSVLLYYDISINGITVRKRNINYLSLQEFAGLQAGKQQYVVEVTAVLKDGSRITQTTKINILE